MEKSEYDFCSNRLDILGIPWSDNNDGSVDYQIRKKVLVMGFDGQLNIFALDDETNTQFKTWAEIMEFYKLPLLPDNILTKEDYIEYLNVIAPNNHDH